MHDDDDTPDAALPDAEPRARDVVRAKETLPRDVAGARVVGAVLRREQRRPAGNSARTWNRVAGEDPFVIAQLEGDVVRATTYVDGRFVRIDQQAKEAARQRQGGVPTPPSSWSSSNSAEAAIPAAFRNIPVASRAEGERAPNQGESLIPAGFRDLPIAKPKEHAPSAAEVAAKRRAAEASQGGPATPVPTTATTSAPPPSATRPAHSSSGRAMLTPRARTPVGPTVRPTPPQPAAVPPPTASPPTTTPTAPAITPPTPVRPPPSLDADTAARQAQRGAGGSLDDLFQRPSGGTEGRARLGRRGAPPADTSGKPTG